MLSWDQIEREACDHLDGVEAAAPWIRLRAASDARADRSPPLAMTRAVLRGCDMVKLAAFVCPAERLRVTMALALGDPRDLGLARLQQDQVVQLFVPMATLSWEGLLRAVEQLVVHVRFTTRPRRSELGASTGLQSW